MPRCQGKTRSGKQCSRTVDTGERYCYQHAEDAGAANAPAGGSGRGKKGNTRKFLAAAAATAATVAAVTVGVDELKKRKPRKKKLFGRKRRS